MGEKDERRFLKTEYFFAAKEVPDNYPLVSSILSMKQRSKQVAFIKLFEILRTSLQGNFSSDMVNKPFALPKFKLHHKAR